MILERPGHVQAFAGPGSEGLNVAQVGGQLVQGIRSDIRDPSIGYRQRNS